MIILNWINAHILATSSGGADCQRAKISGAPKFERIGSESWRTGADKSTKQKEKSSSEVRRPSIISLIP